MKRNVFSHLELAPPDPILGTTTAFLNDKDPKKVNLGVGAYRDNSGKPVVFSAVKKAEKVIVDNPAINKEYLPISGFAPFVETAQKLILGESSVALKEKRVASIQTLSGTGALRIGFDFLRKFIPAPVYVSKPTWGNHNSIIAVSGLPCREYPYWDQKRRGIDFEAMTNCLETCPSGSIILLHSCAHNPTGCDPTEEQWKKLAEICQRRNLVPFFDSAYQGFASGDFEKDAFSIRYFISQGLNMIITQSFAKNFGLYGERVGALHVVCDDAESAKRVLSQIEIIVRTNYSNPPKHGAMIVDTIYRNPDLYREYLAELKAISGRIIDCRTQLRAEVEKLKVPGDWSHITSQIGMFSYTGLSPAQSENMINKWHIYMLKNGRISMAGINSSNVVHVAQGIADSVANCK